MTNGSATITWTTNEPANSQVEYGPTTSYGTLTPLDATLVTAHSTPMTGLSPQTTYNYRVRSTDAAGNLRLGTNRTFTTLAGPPDVTPPSVPDESWGAGGLGDADQSVLDGVHGQRRRHGVQGVSQRDPDRDREHAHLCECRPGAEHELHLYGGRQRRAEQHIRAVVARQCDDAAGYHAADGVDYIAGQ